MRSAIAIVLLFLGFSLSAEVLAVTQEDLMDFSTGNIKQDEPRLNAIREFGMQVGAQGGMIERSKSIVAETLARSNDLDRAFAFQPMISRDGLLPPVVSKVSQDIETKDDAQRIEFAGTTYKIIRPAIFVRVTPTWRDYLLSGLSDDRMEIEKLPESLRPETAKEKRIWQSAVADGWKLGITQADDIYKENLQRLKRDYLGMVTFKFLESQNMIKAPVLSESSEVAKVTDDQIMIGVGVKTIESRAAMESNQGDWGRMK